MATRKPKTQNPAPESAITPTPIAPPQKRKRFQPPHVPTDKTRARVTAWSGGGIEQKMIAASIPDPTPDKPHKLGISVPTLIKHYKTELLTGKAMMDGLAISALGAAMQRGGKEAVVAAKWWTQSRMGWTERIEIDDKSADTPMRVIVEYVGEAAPARVEQSAPRTRLADDVRKNVQLVG
jgi:hypothetical protein